MLDLAKTTRMSAKGLLVIQVLAPVSRYPFLDGSALLRIACGSEPASGSVRPKTADPFAGGQSWQIFAALSLAAIDVDRAAITRKDCTLIMER